MEVRRRDADNMDVRRDEMCGETRGRQTQTQRNSDRTKHMNWGGNMTRGDDGAHLSGQKTENKSLHQRIKRRQGERDDETRDGTGRWQTRFLGLLQIILIFFVVEGVELFVCWTAPRATCHLATSSCERHVAKRSSSRGKCHARWDSTG